jgi:5'-nucleotidase
MVLSTMAIPAFGQAGGESAVDIACPDGAPDAGFTDVPSGNVHSDAIDCGVDLGVIAGTSATTYTPMRSVTRGQVASLIVRALTAAGVELPPLEGSPNFPDIGPPHGDNIRRLAAAGIVQGQRDGTYGTSLPVRRDQLASLYMRAASYVAGETLTPDERGYFSDVDSGVHAANIDAAFEFGIMNGKRDGRFDPLGATRRDQAATVVVNFLALLFEDYAVVADVTLLATNDFHGRIAIEPPTTYRIRPEGETDQVLVGGAAFLATHLDNIRAENPNTLYVDAGDLVGATPVLSNYFFDEPTVDVMNEIGLDVQTVGNHEFDRGQDEILRRLQGGCHPNGCFDDDRPFAGQEFETLSTNVIVEETGEALTEPYAIYDMAGVSVGFLGVTTVNTPNVVNPAGIEGLEFLPEAEAVNEWVPVLEEEGVDAIVVLLHEGGRQDGTYNQCENFRGAAAEIIDDLDEAVDVVITGHTHEAYVCDFEDGPLVTSANEYGTMFTEINLTIDRRLGVTAREATNHLVTRDVERHPGVQEIVDYYNELAGPVFAEVVGASEVPVPRTTRSAESRQGNLATDALRDQFDGVDFAFQNSGGLRAPLTTTQNPDTGLYDIRRQDVLDVWPFGNTVAIAEVDGPTLRNILRNGVREIGGGRFVQLSGLRIEYVIDPTVAPGDNGGFPRGEVVNVEYWKHPDFPDGTPVDLTAASTYTIAMNDFMAVGGDGYPNIQDDLILLGDPLEIVIEAYLQANSPVSPQIEGRIVDITPRD